MRAIEDEDVLRRIADSQVCLDVCRTSNVQLSVVPSFETHLLLQLLLAGVACSINADDPLLFSLGLCDEYCSCREVLGLTDDLLASIARASLDASGAPPEVVRRGLAGIEDWLDS